MFQKNRIQFWLNTKSFQSAQFIETQTKIFARLMASSLGTGICVRSQSIGRKGSQLSTFCDECMLIKSRVWCLDMTFFTNTSKYPTRAVQATAAVNIHRCWIKYAVLQGAVQFPTIFDDSGICNTNIFEVRFCVVLCISDRFTRIVWVSCGLDWNERWKHKHWFWESFTFSL